MSEQAGDTSEADTPPLGRPAAPVCRALPEPLSLRVDAAPENYRRGMAGRPVRRIVIHCTDGHAEALPVARMWQTVPSGSRHTSAHYVVGQDGTIIQAVALDDVAQHAHAASSDSVGIEHCARTPREFGPGDPGLAPSEALLEASAHLVAWLCQRYQLPIDRAHVMGHAEADPATTHTACPDGCGWPWDGYLARMREISGA